VGAVVHVRVDHSALVRGHVEPGETCEIPGVGPIPVAAARGFVSDCFLAAVVADGKDVKAVSHLGRTIPERLKTALVERDPVCVVPGCGEHRDLAFDHIVPVYRRGRTSLHNLARLCRWHHYLKTYHHYVLDRVGGEWIWVGPHGPPRDPEARQPELLAAG
ncbi:MAG: HNH endonuclease, partial [Actinomycetota bacterium]|nr:HNH endonuclease [Actinomycetota bacterium]